MSEEIKKLSQAMEKSIEAGNMEDARYFANAIKQMAKQQSGGQKPAAQPQGQSYASGLVDSFTSGAALGWGNELTALEAGLLGKTPEGDWFNYEKSFGERYDDALAAENAQNAKFKEENPYSAGAAEITGAIAMPLGAGMRGATLMRPGMGALASVGAGAAEGALYGAAAGAGYGDEGNRLSGATGGALFGGAVGAAVPAAIGGYKAIRAGAKGRAISAADRFLQEAMERDGLTLQEAKARLAKLGPNSMPLDLGGNVQGMGEGLASIPGRGKKAITDALTGRNAGSNQRITQTVDDALGPAPMPTEVQAGVRQGQQALSPDYAKSLTGAQSVDTIPIAERVLEVARGQRGPAQKAAISVYKMLQKSELPSGSASKSPLDKVVILDTDPSTLLKVRRAIDGMVGPETNDDVVRVLTEVRKQIDEELAAKIPGIKEVDARFRELAKQREGFEAGQDVFAQGKTALRPKEFQAKYFEASTPDGAFVGPSGEAFMMRQGARAKIDLILGTNLNDKVALRNLIKGDGDWNRAKLVTLFGERKAKAVMDVVEREMEFSRTSNNILGNSRTTPRAQMIRDLSGEKLGQIGDDVTLPGLAVRLGRSTAGRVAKAFNAPGLERRNEELAQLLIDRAKFEQSLARSSQRQNQLPAGDAASRVPSLGGSLYGPAEITITPNDIKRR